MLKYNPRFIIIGWKLIKICSVENIASFLSLATRVNPKTPMQSGVRAFGGLLGLSWPSSLEEEPIVSSILKIFEIGFQIRIPWPKSHNST